MLCKQAMRAYAKAVELDPKDSTALAALEAMHKAVESEVSAHAQLQRTTCNRQRATDSLGMPARNGLNQALSPAWRIQNHVGDVSWT